MNKILRLFTGLILLLSLLVPLIPSHPIEAFSPVVVSTNLSTQFTSNPLIDGYGILIKTGTDNMTYFFRQGTTLEADVGSIKKRVYTISTKTWGAQQDVYSDPAWDCRDIGGGMIGSTIFLTFHKYTGASASHDAGYIKSTDGGTTWSAYVPLFIPGPNTVVNLAAPIIETDNPGTYLMPYVIWNSAANTEQLGVLGTSDSGVTWSTNTTIYGPSTFQLGEPHLAYIGSGKIIGLARNDNAGGGPLYQYTSSDNGATWTTPVVTPLGAATMSKPHFIDYDSVTDRVVCLIQDRYDNFVKYSEAPAKAVFANPLAWASSQNLLSYSATSSVGYPSLVKITEGQYFGIWMGDAPGGGYETYGGYINTQIDNHWWDNDYLYRKVLSCNTTFDTYDIYNAFDTVNATIHVRLTSANFDFSTVATPTGVDIKFVDRDDQTELKTDNATWDLVNEVAEFWVSKPIMRGRSRFSDWFYMYWGNALAADTHDAAAVWLRASAIAVYHFSENTGTNVLDSSGNSHNGTLMNGATWIDYAVSLNGTGQYVTIPDSANISSLGPITIIASGNTTTTSRGLVSKAGADPNREWVVYGVVGTGRPIAMFFDQVYANRVEADSNLTSLTDGAWHTTVVRWDATNALGHINMYVDNTKQTFGVDNKYGTGGVPVDTSAPIEIGRWNSDNGTCWVGNIDEVRIYSLEVLNAHVFTETKNREGTLLNYGPTYISPTLVTNAASSLSMTKDGVTSGTLSGNLTGKGGDPSDNVSVWFELGTAGYDTYAGFQSTNNTGAFTGSLPASLTPGATYQVRAAGQNAILGTGYASAGNFTLTMPTISSIAATNLVFATGASSATLNGELTNIGAASSTYVYFQWGYDGSYGANTTAVTKTGATDFSVTITGFDPGKTVYFRAVARNGSTISYGSGLTLTTKRQIDNYPMLEPILLMIPMLLVTAIVWTSARLFLMGSRSKDDTKRMALLYAIASLLLVVAFAGLQILITVFNNMLGL